MAAAVSGPSPGYARSNSARLTPPAAPETIYSTETVKPLKVAQHEFRRAYVLHAIAVAGSKNKATKLLGLSCRSHLYRILNRPV